MGLPGAVVYLNTAAEWRADHFDAVRNQAQRVVVATAIRNYDLHLICVIVPASCINARSDVRLLVERGYHDRDLHML